MFLKTLMIALMLMCSGLVHADTFVTNIPALATITPYAGYRAYFLTATPGIPNAIWNASANRWDFYSANAGTNTVTPTPTITETFTSTSTATRTNTATNTATNTGTNTTTFTTTPTITPTATNTIQIITNQSFANNGVQLIPSGTWTPVLIFTSTPTPTVAMTATAYVPFFNNVNGLPNLYQSPLTLSYDYNSGRNTLDNAGNFGINSTTGNLSLQAPSGNVTIQYGATSDLGIVASGGSVSVWDRGGLAVNGMLGTGGGLINTDANGFQYGDNGNIQIGNGSAPGGLIVHDGGVPVTVSGTAGKFVWNVTECGTSQKLMWLGFSGYTNTAPVSMYWPEFNGVIYPPSVMMGNIGGVTITEVGSVGNYYYYVVQPVVSSVSGEIAIGGF